jgi:MoxR-like ATPase
VALPARKETKPEQKIGLEAGLASTSLLADLGIIGFRTIEPVLLAALILEEPLLLIGAHGTGKSYALLRIAAALGLESRHYNASLLNFDDLVGFPVPNPNGGLDYAKTPGSIWGAQVVFFDEISRCRPDMQNKLFPIVHERRVQGVAIEGLVHRWSAMNPPCGEEDETTSHYRGSEQLDIALADRFAFIIEIPEWNTFTAAEQEQVIGSKWLTPEAAVCSNLRRILWSGRGLIQQLLNSEFSGRLSTYVRILSSLLQQSGLPLSPRRLNMLKRNIIGVHASRVLIEKDPAFAESALLALTHSFPQRALGRKVELIKLVASHRQAWTGAVSEEPGPLLHILTEPDPLQRAIYAVSAQSLSKSEFSTVIADALAQLPPGARHALSAELFQSEAAGRLIAAVADQCAELYATVITPQAVSESIASGSPRHEVWKYLISCLGALRADKRTADMAANLLAGLFAANALASPEDVDKVLASWLTTRQLLGATRV